MTSVGRGSRRSTRGPPRRRPCRTGPPVADDRDAADPAQPTRRAPSAWMGPKSARSTTSAPRPRGGAGERKCNGSSDAGNTVASATRAPSTATSRTRCRRGPRPPPPCTRDRSPGRRPCAPNVRVIAAHASTCVSPSSARAPSPWRSPATRRSTVSSQLRRARPAAPGPRARPARSMPRASAVRRDATRRPSAGASADDLGPPHVDVTVTGSRVTRADARERRVAAPTASRIAAARRGPRARVSPARWCPGRRRRRRANLPADAPGSTLGQRGASPSRATSAPPACAATSRARPTSRPASIIASTTRNTYAGPEPDRPVTASSIGSPDAHDDADGAEQTFREVEMFGPAWVPPAIADAPSPTSAGIRHGRVPQDARGRAADTCQRQARAAAATLAAAPAPTPAPTTTATPAPAAPAAGMGISTLGRRPRDSRHRRFRRGGGGRCRLLLFVGHQNSNPPLRAPSATAFTRPWYW